MKRAGHPHLLTRTSLLTAFSLLASLIALVAPPGGGSVDAIDAPTTPRPACVTDEAGTPGRGCLPGDTAAIVSGTFATGSTFTIDAGEIGFSPCADYVSTGCYYSVSSPTIGTCVYLYRGDPTDVRSCRRSLSSSGSSGALAAQRQGTCRGELGSTYAIGGPSNGDPATWWVNRGPATANCEYRVSDDIEFDELDGPTFFLVSASVRECIEPGGGWGCDESWATLERHTRYAWLPVEGSLAPKAEFEPQVGGDAGSAVSFENRSTPFHDGPTTYEWDFGDGSPISTADSPTHTFTAAGRYRVRLTMRGDTDAKVRSTSAIVDLTAPDLVVSVWNPDAEFGPGEDGNRMDLGDEFTVRVDVRATDGAGSLRNVAPVSELLTLPLQLQLVGDPVQVAPATFGTGDHATYETKVRAVGAGRVTIRSTWQGTDAGGSPDGPWTGSFDLGVTGLQVTVEADPDSFTLEDTDEDGDIDEDDENFVDVDVTAKNVTQTEITDVRRSPISVTSKTDDATVGIVEIEVPTDDPATGDVDEGDFGDLEPSEEKTLRWRFRADEATHVELTTLVTGSASGVTVVGRGTEVVKVFDRVLLEARVDVVEEQSFRSGTPVRITGSFENVTDDGESPETISFAIAPVISEAFGGTSLEVNGAAGYFAPDGPSAVGIERFELAPGETTTMTAIVQTVETHVPSGFRVDYQAVVAIKEVAESGEVNWNAQGELAVDFVDEDGFSDRHDVSLGLVPEPPEEDTNFITCDDELLWAAEYVGCKLVRGVETMGRGLGDLAMIAWNIAKIPAATYGWMLGTTVAIIDADPAARSQMVTMIADDVVAEIEALWRAGHEAVRNIDLAEIALLVPQFIDQSLTRLKKAWDGGPEKFFGELAEIAGENIDMVVEALVAARTLARLSKAIAAGEGPIRDRLQKAWAARRTKGLAEVDRIIATEGHRAVPGSRVLPSGVDITDLPKIWRDSYGLSREQFRRLSELAEEYGVNIVFRSRAPEAVDLIKSNRALPKPQGIKTKGVNRIDIDFLDYPSKYDGVVVHMEPPIPWTRDPGVLESTSADYARKVLGEKRPELAPGTPEYDDLFAQVQSRLKTRTEEWGELTYHYTEALKKRPDGKPVGVQVDFDGEFNGLKKSDLRHEPNREIQLLPSESVGGRSLYEVKLKAPDGHPRAGEFLDVTGDVDYLAILNMDGRILGANGDPAELAKRIELYEAMRTIGMQHGESFSIFDNAKVRAKYLRDGLDAEGGETLIAVTPQKRLVTTYFDDGLSTLKGGPSSQLGELQQARAFFSGIFTELKTPGRPWSTLLLDELASARRRLLVRIPVLFDLNVLRNLVLGLGGTDAEVSRDGANLRPDGEGGIEGYVTAADVAGPRGIVDVAPQPGASVHGVRSPASDVVAELDRVVTDLEAQGADFSEPVGAAGGRWVPVELDDVVADGTLSIAPYAYLLDHAPAGSIELDVTDRTHLSLPARSGSFAVGDEIVVDPGGDTEERAVIARVSPMRLTRPLSNSHDELTSVVMAAPGSIIDPSTGVPESPEAPSRPTGTSDPTDPPSRPSRPPVGESGDGSSDEATLVPLTPARLVETRLGEDTVDGEFAGIGRLAAGSVTTVRIAGRGGVAPDASAIALNVTAIRPDEQGYVTLFPCDADRPTTSSLNYGPDDVVGNTAVVRLSGDGDLCVYTFAAVDLVLDATAYAADSPSIDPLVPARLVDSRPLGETVDGGGRGFGRLAGDSVTVIDVVGRGDVEPGTAAVAVNTTVVAPDDRGYVTLFPCDGDRPLASSLNYEGGRIAGNSGVVALSGEGTLCAYASASAHLVVDVTAAFSVDPTFVPLTPARLLETRPGAQSVDGRGALAARLGAGSVTTIRVVGRAGIPSEATAVAVNATAVGPSERGYVTLFPCDGPRPLASSLNFGPGEVVGNSGIVKLAADGTLCAYTFVETHLVLDVNAAWAA